MTSMLTRYVALLRGINVGGKNLVKMTDLAACFEAQGLREVSTFIASGNVLFEVAGQRSAARLRARLEAALSTRFNWPARVALRSAAQLRRVVDLRPRGFGSAPGRYRYDVIFLLEPLTAEAAVAQLNPRQGVDRVFAGDGVVYFSRLIARASQSRLSRVVSLPAYQQMTIRSWSTTTRLLALLGR